MSHSCLTQFEYDGNEVTWYINPLFATLRSSRNTLDRQLSSIILIILGCLCVHLQFVIYFWFVVLSNIMVQLAGKDTSWHQHILCLYSSDESGFEPQQEQIMHFRSDKSIITSWPDMNNWFDQLLVSDVALAPIQSMTFGTKDMLFECIFGWRKHCCWFVCCPGHGVAQLIECIDVSPRLTIREQCIYACYFDTAV